MGSSLTDLYPLHVFLLRKEFWSRLVRNADKDTIGLSNKVFNIEVVWISQGLRISFINEL